LALASKLLGKNKGHLIIIFHIIALYLTSIVIYHISRKVFNAETGILAGTILPLIPHVIVESKTVFAPAIFAGLLISICAYLVIWTIEKTSVRRGLLLGAVLGFSCLVYAPILAFIPLSVIYLLFSADVHSKVSWKNASAVLFAALILISPWTLRNYAVFGKLIPVKTGFGKVAYESNPILASTYSSGPYGCSDVIDPPWISQNVREAIIVSGHNQVALVQKGFECMEKEAHEGYEEFNEAEWNSLFLEKTFDFILTQPLIFAEMTYYRILYFFTFMNLKIIIISVLFVISAIITLKNKKARVLTLFGLIFSFTYFLVVSFWYRYRYPIEPIFLILASYPPVLLISKISVFSRDKIMRISQSLKN